MSKKFDRCVRKVRRSLKNRRKRGNAFAICNKALFMITSFNLGHRHKWIKGMKFTTISFVTGKHKHKINLRRMITMPSRKGGHSHKLLKRKR